MKQVFDSKLRRLILLFALGMSLAACADKANENRQAVSTSPNANVAQANTADALPPIARAHQSPTVDEDAPVLTSAPRAGWIMLDGRRRDLEDLRGRVVVIDFYATWCAPCIEETPHLVELERRYKAQGLSVVGLNVGGAEDLAEVPAYVEKHGIPYQLGAPDAGFVRSLMGEESAIPQTFVFNREGNLVKRFIGFNETKRAELERVVEQTLGDE